MNMLSAVQSVLAALARYSDAERLYAFELDGLAAGTLTVERWQGWERASLGFEWWVDVLSSDSAWALDDLLGRADTAAAARAWARGEHDAGLAVWRGLAELGACGLAVPERYDGAGADAMDLAVCFTALGYHAVPGPDPALHQGHREPGDQGVEDAVADRADPGQKSSTGGCDPQGRFLPFASPANAWRRVAAAKYR